MVSVRYMVDDVEKAVAFYQRYGFRALVSQPRTLFLPMATTRKALT